MNIGLRTQTGNYVGKLFLTFFLFIIFLPAPAHAVQWKKFARTSLHNVYIEMNSIQHNPDGNIGLWLRFTPRGARQRLEAANDYSKKEYYQHLEYYEINCIEQSAALKQIDILSKNGKRLTRLTDNSSNETIIPGTALDMAATGVCPEPSSVDDNQLQDETILPDIESKTDRQTLEENKQHINKAKTSTETEPSNFKNWAELGNAYYDSEMPKEAIEAYDIALKLKPNDIEILNDQGAMFRRIGKHSKALINYEMVLTIDPNNLESLYSIGYIYAIELNRTKDAIPFWQRYLAIDSSSETAKQIRQYIDKYGK